MANYFGTDGIRGKFGEIPITQNFAYIIAKALAIYIKKIKKKKSRI